MSQSADPRQLVVFVLGQEQYALPIKQVQEIIRYTQPRSIASTEAWIRGVLNLRGWIVPIYDLAARLAPHSGCRANARDAALAGASSHRRVTAAMVANSRLDERGPELIALE